MRVERAKIFLDDQVPENRLAADFDHPPRPILGLLGDARAEAARQSHGFHEALALAADRRKSGPVAGVAT